MIQNNLTLFLQILTLQYIVILQVRVTFNFWVVMPPLWLKILLIYCTSFFTNQNICFNITRVYHMFVQINTLQVLPVIVCWLSICFFFFFTFFFFNPELTIFFWFLVEQKYLLCFLIFHVDHIRQQSLNYESLKILWWCQPLENLIVFIYMCISFPKYEYSKQGLV